MQQASQNCLNFLYFLGGITDQVHNYNTRNSKLHFVPFCRTNIKQFSVVYQGVKLFNSLSEDIRDASSVSSFIKKIKEYLLII